LSSPIARGFSLLLAAIGPYILGRLARTEGCRHVSWSLRLGEQRMLEYLGYALFGVVMIGCLLYIMNALETDEPPTPKQPDRKK
jgi:hypothetical protein